MHLRQKNVFFSSNNNIAQTGEQAYTKLIAYLKPEIKNNLVLQLQALTEDDGFYVTLAKQINQGNWQTLFADCNIQLFPLHALRCLKDGLITDMTFSTSQLFYNVWTHPDNNQNKEIPTRIIEIFNEQGQRKRLADSMIDATLKIVPASYMLKVEAEIEELNKSVNKGFVNLQFLQEVMASSKLFGDEKLWTTDQKKQFYINLLKLPASEHAFIVLPDNIIENILNKKESIMDVINFRIGFNALSRLRSNNQPMRMIPSRGMMQAYLEAISPTTTPKPAYRFGLSTLRGLHKTLKENSRDLFQSFACFPKEMTPVMVDNYSALTRYAEAELHDFYHQMRISHIPLHHRELFNLFADKLLAIAGPLAARNKFAYAMASRVIDMEHSAYEINKNKFRQLYQFMKDLENVNPQQLFWHTINHCVAMAEALLESNGTFDKNKLDETLNQLMNWLLTEEFQSNKEYHSLVDGINEYKHSDLLHSDYLTTRKDELQKNLVAEIYSKHISELVIFLSEDNAATMKNRLGKTFAIGIADQYAEEQLVNSLITHHAFTQDTDLFAKNCKGLCVLEAAILRNINENFADFVKKDIFDKIELDSESQIAFVSLMQNINFHSFYDSLLQLAIDHNEVFVFDALYKQSDVNRVFGSDNKTLLHRALDKENIWLMMRLTNDGAKVVNLKSYIDVNARMCPLEQSIAHGLPVLPALLYFAHLNGKGWMEKYPEIVERLQRLFRDQKGKTLSSEEDEQWQMQLLESMPDWICSKRTDENFNKIKEYNNYTTAFFDEVRKNGHGTPTSEFAAKFGLLKEWKRKGGVLSEMEKQKAASKQNNETKFECK